jgi:hypothetical protein
MSTGEGLTNLPAPSLATVSKAEERVMTTWLPTGSRNLAADSNDRGAIARAGRRALSVLGEVLSIFNRARVTAGYYEELKSRSEADLAEKGMTRGDLPRAAFRKLTGEP